VFDQQFHDATDAHLFLLREVREPPGEVVGAFDVPRHCLIMPLKN